MRRTPAPGLTAAPPFTTRPIAKPYAGREPHARCCRRVPATARAASPAPAPDPGHPAPGAHNERTLRSGRAAGGRGRLAAAGDAELAGNAGHAHAGGLHADEQPSRDLAVARAGRDEPGQPGLDHRLPGGDRRWLPRVRRQRGERQPLRPQSDAWRLAVCARSRAAPPPSRRWQRRRRHRPGRPPSAPARHTAVRSRAERVHSAAAGVQHHAGKLRPAGHDQAGIGNTRPVSAAKLTRPARGPDECQAEPRAGSGPSRLIRASGFRSASYPHADERALATRRD